MQDSKNTRNEAESDILFSKTIKAGQRIYYVDVKKNKRQDMYLSVTESKKMVSGTQDMPQFSYEKHKIFLFPEDFQKFMDSMTEAISYVQEISGETPSRKEEEDAIQIDLDF